MRDHELEDLKTQVLIHKARTVLLKEAVKTLIDVLIYTEIETDPESVDPTCKPYLRINRQALRDMARQLDMY